ncbi:hypothetical protein ACH427_09240 [Streptomyces sp. NPDC020379]|uniref:hypothetical protein n=1 Tax=Streptomyces sp. NPDC020379 TaxID=3365071 RepID=UPI003788D8A8
MTRQASSCIATSAAPMSAPGAGGCGRAPAGRRARPARAESGLHAARHSGERAFALDGLLRLSTGLATGVLLALHAAPGDGPGPRAPPLLGADP